VPGGWRLKRGVECPGKGPRKKRKVQKLFITCRTGKDGESWLEQHVGKKKNGGGSSKYANDQPKRKKFSWLKASWGETRQIITGRHSSEKVGNATAYCQEGEGPVQGMGKKKANTGNLKGKNLQGKQMWSPLLFRPLECSTKG